MPNQYYHLKVKENHAADVIDALLKNNAVEDIEHVNEEMTQWQKDAIDKELVAIENTPNYLLNWEDAKHQFKRNAIPHTRHFIIKKDYANHLLDLLINDDALKPITNDENDEFTQDMKNAIDTEEEFEKKDPNHLQPWSYTSR